MADATLEPPISLEEAAAVLGITTTDTTSPSRYVRELIRRHRIPFVRIGRTVKLRPEHLRLLAERMVVQPAEASEPSDGSSWLQERMTQLVTAATDPPVEKPPAGERPKRPRSEAPRVENPLRRTRPRKRP